jgi:hypothetical protein
MTRSGAARCARPLVRQAWLASIVWLLAGPVAAQNQLADTFALNDHKRVLDGQWQGIRYASDGNVYFASSTHSAHHGASFFKYTPATNQLTLLAEDITVICGEDPQTNPQGKLHSDLVEANGWLYMSTYFSSELPGAFASWTGSHVIGYELATGRFRDYGVIHPGYTSYSAVGVDPLRNYVYVFLTGGQGSFIYRIDAVTGAKVNLGQVGAPWGKSNWMFVDQRGDVWFSLGDQDGNLQRIRGATGAIDVFPNALPPLYRWDVNQVHSSATEQSKRWIRWMQPLDGDRAVFTLGNWGGALYLFDSSKPIGSGQEFQVIQHVGYTDLGLAVGNNRVFYYQRANRGFGHQDARDFHLLSVSLDSAAGNPITDHGLLIDPAGRLVWRAPGMDTDGRDTVFLIGDWWTVPGDLGTLRYTYTNGVESYQQLPRGQFFATASVGDEQPASALASLILSPSTAFGGTRTSENRVTLSGPAPDGGLAVTLSSGDPDIAAVPDSVVVPAGATTSPAFSIATQTVASDHQVVVRAAADGVTRSATLRVTGLHLARLALSSASLDAGTPGTPNTVHLNGPAPDGGAIVLLSSSNPTAAAVPESVLVAAGATASGSFTITTGLVSVPTPATITATLNGESLTAVVTVQPVLLSALTLNPTTVAAGSPTAGNRVALTRQAPPDGIVVALSSSHPGVASVPATVQVPAGATSSPEFPITTTATGTTTSVKITARLGSLSRTATLTIYPVTLTTVTLSPTTTNGGTPTTANRVTLSRAAPPDGALVTLTSSNPAAAWVAESVLVPGGATTSAAFSIGTALVTTTTWVRISARFAGVTRTSTLTIYPVALAGITLSPTAVSAGSAAVSNKVRLNRPAPPGGAVVRLSSSNPAAQTPESVLIPAGATTSPTFAITTVPVRANTLALITASYGGISRTASLAVYAVTVNSVSLSPTGVNAGSPTTANRVVLTRPAPAGGATVTLSSSNPALARPPESVLVAAGSTTSPNFSIQTSALSSTTNVSVTISASFGGVTRAAVLTVQPVTLSTLTLSPVSVKGGLGTTSNRVTLNRAAPPGGAAVTLTSSRPDLVMLPPVVIVPSSVTASPNFAIQTHSVAASTQVAITASFGSVSRTVTLTLMP